MTESTENPSTKELLDRIVRLETSTSRLCDRIEALELHNVAEYYNRQIDQKLDEYEKKQKLSEHEKKPSPDCNGAQS